MKRPGVTLAAVVVVGLAAGAAIAGRSATPVHDARISEAPDMTAATTVGPTAASVSATTSPTTPASPTAKVTSTTSTTSTTTAPATTAPATTAPTATVAVTTTTSVTVVTFSDRSTLRILVANAGDASGIARAEAARLATLGYPKPVTDDAIERIAQTTVYARAGLEAEGLQLLADAGLAADRLQPFPSRRVTTLDDRADLILALGIDWA